MTRNCILSNGLIQEPEWIPQYDVSGCGGLSGDLYFFTFFSALSCKVVISKAAQEVQEKEEIMHVREVLQEQKFYLEYEDSVSTSLKSLQ